MKPEIKALKLRQEPIPGNNRDGIFNLCHLKFFSENCGLHKNGQSYGEHRPNKVEPQIAQFLFATWIDENGKIINDKNGGLANDRTIKNSFCLHIFYIKTHQENSQNRSVENGTDNINQLNQVFEQCSNTGKKDGDNSPK